MSPAPRSVPREPMVPSIPTAAQIENYAATMAPTSAEAEIDAMRFLAQQFDELNPAARRRVLAYAQDRYPTHEVPAIDTVMSWALGLLREIGAHAVAGGGAEADEALWRLLKGTRFAPASPKPGEDGR